VLSFLKKENRNGLNVKYSPTMGTSQEIWLRMMEDGILILTCPQIEQDFVFVRENNGRGIFGGQKALYRVYLGDALLDDYSPARSFVGLTLALFSINNIFRANGVISGGAF